jgi:hypothetical protein
MTSNGAIVAVVARSHRPGGLKSPGSADRRRRPPRLPTAAAPVRPGFADRTRARSTSRRGHGRPVRHGRRICRGSALRLPLLATVPRSSLTRFEFAANRNGERS